ncbi:MFS transporter [Actinocrispum wychmicini]|uniref:EmrB/QacA subfamily drug resistance transporter n=1 Tax=Actinocrispum wychmicini TaxID=1213861 RepID=A0A4V2S7M5_9PSEU|nr:MFS transporter [Actinocrispum wychmicini]TCO60650.1 EmrB/QacA subfamily drug resistance transporter [Actinocrispum wychmicini]
MTTTTATARDWTGLAVVLAATFMGQVDGFIVNVASPTIQRDLPAGFDQIQLVGAAYVFACAAGLVTGGRLGDRFGRRRVFLAGVTVFTIASLCCGLAPNADLLIAFRFGQGAAAAALIPQELAIVRTMFHDDAQRARALGAYGVALGLGVIAGIAGGGILVDLDVAGLGWRSVFLLNVPIGVAILALGRFTIGESRSETTVRLDTVGALLTAFSIPALLVPLIFGPRAGWSVWVWVSALVGVLLIVVLASQQRRNADPLYPPHVLATPGFPLSMATLAAFFAGNAGLFLVFTYHLQTGLGLDPMAAGLMFTPLGIGFAAGSALTGRLGRYGTRVPVAGTGLIAVCLLVMATAAGMSQAPLAVLIGLIGLGQGLVVAPLVGVVLGRVTPDEAGAASGIASTVVQFGLAFGFAMIGVLYRTVLGGTPGDAAIDPSHHSAAFTAATLVLAGTAAVTSVLCWYLARPRKITGTNRPDGATV